MGVAVTFGRPLGEEPPEDSHATVSVDVAGGESDLYCYDIGSAIRVSLEDTVMTQCTEYFMAVDGTKLHVDLDVVVPSGQKLMSTQNRICATIEEDENFAYSFENGGQMTECEIKFTDARSSADRQAKLEFTVDFDTAEGAQNMYSGLISNPPDATQLRELVPKKQALTVDPVISTKAESSSAPVFLSVATSVMLLML